MGKSYGLIEVPSTTAAIDALDIMCKTADPPINGGAKGANRRTLLFFVFK